MALDEVTMVMDTAETVSEPMDAAGEGGVEAQASGSDAASAFRRFEAAVVAARERLTELTELQQQIDEN